MNNITDLVANPPEGHLKDAEAELDKEESFETVAPTPIQPKTDAVLEALLGSIGDPSEQITQLKVMIYSNPGAGKTHLIGGIPNSLMIDSEQGNIVLTPDIIAPGMKRIPFKSFYQLDMLTEYIANRDPNFDWAKTLTLDTVSTIHKDGLGEVKDQQHKLIGNSVNRYKAETEDHTENNEHIRRIIREFIKRTDRNLVLTAHARFLEPKGQDARTFPDFSEKLANTIAGMMDIVGYLYETELDGKPARVLKVRPSSGIAAKTRVTTMPDNIIDPTWEKILEYVASHNAKIDN